MKFFASLFFLLPLTLLGQPGFGNVTPVNQLSVVETMNQTHVGTTLGVGYKQNIPTNIIYLAGGSGMVKHIQYTSDAQSIDRLDLRTNYALRVYVDAGTINFGSASLSLPAANLLAEFPLGSLMMCNYWPAFKTNVSVPLKFSTKYVKWVEVPTQSSAGFLGHYTVSIDYTIPFGNGIAIVLWDYLNNNFTNSGFSFVSYELGKLPQGFETYRLRTYHTISNGLTANSPIILNYTTGGGELASLYLSSRGSGNDVSYFEGQWVNTVDGIGGGAGNPWGCPGGEDMFFNGYFFDAGPMIMDEAGTRYIHGAGNLVGSDNYVNESFRNYSGADGIRWLFSQNMWFQGGFGLTTFDWNSLAIFYGK